MPRATSGGGISDEATYNGKLTTLNLEKALTRRYHSRATRYPLPSSLRDALFAELRGYDAVCRRWEAIRERIGARIVAEGWSLEPLDPRAAALLKA